MTTRFTLNLRSIIMKTNSTAASAARTNSNIQSLAITALSIALVYLFTAFVNVQLPFGGKGGLIHLGNIPLFIFAILFGKKTGAIAGGIGMGLFDLVSGWTMWAPFTFVIVGLMGYVTGLVTEKKKTYATYVLAMVLACIIKIVGYYIAEGILYGNWIVPFASIPGNLIQVGTAAFVVLIIITPLKKAAEAILL